MRPLYGAAIMAVCIALCACAYMVRKQGGPPNRGRGHLGSAREMQCDPGMQTDLGARFTAQVLSPPIAAQPMITAQPVAAPQPVLLQVACPPDAGPGTVIAVQAPDGRQVQ